MKTILIVEDVEFNLDLLVQLLEENYQLLVARDGLTGLQTALTGNPDLVLMDMSLPGMDGWEVTRRLKDDPVFGTTPVIGLSAHAMDGDEEKARQAGCDDYLTKPVDEDLLLTRLKFFLGE